MAHELNINEQGKASFAYTGDAAWHGLGQQLTPNSPIPVWIEEAGFNFDIEESPVQALANFKDKNNAASPIITFPEKKLLYRSDTLAPLSVVGQKYKVVQPREVLEFYEDLVAQGGFQLETAGVLFGGKRYFALAKVAAEQEVVKGDKIKGYLLLSTSVDGSATSAQFTSVRVVCNNTLQFALRDHNEQEQPRIRVPHSATFDPKLVKTQLGLAQSSFDLFMTDMRRLAARPLSNNESIGFLTQLFGNPQLALADQDATAARLMKEVHALYQHSSLGNAIAGKTAWGMLNAVTEYTDHHTGHKTDDARIDSAWFGTNANLKNEALNQLLIITPLS